MDPGPGSGGVEVVDLPSVSVEALVDLGHSSDGLAVGDD